jgi:hypothetical protein
MTTGSQGSSQNNQQSSQGSSIMTFSQWNLRQNSNNSQSSSGSQNQSQSQSQGQSQSNDSLQQLTNALRESRTLFQKYGATSFNACQIQSGRDAGQYLTVVTFPNWEAYGTAMNNIEQDDSYRKLQNDVQQVATLSERTIISEIALPN